MKRSFLVGLMLLAPTSAYAVWVQEDAIERHVGRQVVEAGELYSVDFDSIRLDTLKRNLGFTGEVVPWPVMSPEPPK
jgi:hypothetical protein